MSAAPTAMPDRASCSGTDERRLEALLAECRQVSVRLGSALSLRYFSHVDEVPRPTVGV